MELQFLSKSSKQTENLARELGKRINSRCIIAFNGELGAGKTCFTSGLCSGIGYAGYVTSPTFALINEYYGGRLPVFHFDLYRIEDEDELYAIGFYDYLEKDAVLVIEWSERAKAILPDDTIYIDIVYCKEDQREIKISCKKDFPFLKELEQCGY